MASGWRIVNERHAREAFDGDGARRHGGRWNSPGLPMVYLAAHQSLAVLEILANARPASPREDYVLIPASWDEALMERLPESDLPMDWQAQPPSPATAAIGDSWARAVRSAVLAVPSVVLPAETNFLINPQHPDFRRIKIGKPIPFIFRPAFAPVVTPARQNRARASIHLRHEYRSA